MWGHDARRLERANADTVGVRMLRGAFRKVGFRSFERVTKGCFCPGLNEIFRLMNLQIMYSGL